MKKLFLSILILMCFVSVGNCQCTATKAEVKEGVNGVILVGTDYIFNGTPEPNRDYITYFPEEFAKMTAEEKQAKIQADIDARCEEIIEVKYSKANDFPINEYRKSIVSDEINKIKDLILTTEKIKTEVILDETKKAEIYADGSKIISDISAIISK